MWLLQWALITPMGIQHKKLLFDLQEDMFNYIATEKLKEVNFLYIQKFSRIVQPEGVIT